MGGEGVFVNNEIGNEIQKKKLGVFFCACWRVYD